MAEPELCACGAPMGAPWSEHRQILGRALPAGGPIQVETPGDPSELEAIVRAAALPTNWVCDALWCKGCGALCDGAGTMDEPHHASCPFGRAGARVAAHPEAE